MQGSTLSTVLTMLKAECGLTGTADDTLLYQLIINKHTWYAERYSWALFRDQWDKLVAANDQYVGFPTTNTQNQTKAIRWDRPVRASVFWNDVYTPLDYGISEEQYNSFNFASGQTQDPIQRWQRSAGNSAEFEVWPVAATAQTVRFFAERPPATIDTANPTTTIVELDDLLIALTVAADYLRSKGKPAWEIKVGLARELLLQLRSGDPDENDTFRIGRDMEGLAPRNPRPRTIKL